MQLQPKLVFSVHTSFWLQLHTNSGASGDGLEYQNSEAFQGEVWRGRGLWEVENHKEFIAFWHLAGLGLWAAGHVHSTNGHVCPVLLFHPSKTYAFS